MKEERGGRKMTGGENRVGGGWVVKEEEDNYGEGRGMSEKGFVRV